MSKASHVHIHTDTILMITKILEINTIHMLITYMYSSMQYAVSYQLDIVKANG